MRFNNIILVLPFVLAAGNPFFASGQETTSSLRGTNNKDIASTTNDDDKQIDKLGTAETIPVVPVEEPVPPMEPMKAEREMEGGQKENTMVEGHEGGREKGGMGHNSKGEVVDNKGMDDDMITEGDNGLQFESAGPSEGDKGYYKGGWGRGGWGWRKKGGWNRNYNNNWNNQRGWGRGGW
ncbi:hypothetical protein VYU27_003612 [Nannochloropsis oceanica]